MKTVVSQRGLKWWANIVARVILLGWLIETSFNFGKLIIIKLPTTKSFEMQIITIVFFLMCFICIFVVFEILKHFFQYTIMVSKDGIYEIMGNEKTFHSFENINKIKMHFHSTKYTQWKELELFLVNQKDSAILQTRRFDNTRELNLVIMDQSRVINPEIQIDSACLTAYRHHP